MQADGSGHSRSRKSGASSHLLRRAFAPFGNFLTFSGKVARFPARSIDIVAILVALTLAASLTAQPSQPAPRPGDTVAIHTVRPGDTLIGLTERYLGNGRLWPENARLNPQLKDPHRLTPGARIRIIVKRELPRANALMTHVSRKVESKPNPDPWKPAREGELLQESDGVRTFAKSSAELRFGDSSHLQMTENSLVFLKEMRRAPETRGRDTVEIIDGQVDLKASDSRNAADVVVVVGSASVTHRAQAGRPVNARSRKAEGAKAQVMVYGGSSDVASGGRSVKVAEGMGTQVEQGKAPAPPERLLRAPRQVAPLAGRAMQTALQWEAVPNARSYTVEVFRDANTTQLVDKVVGLEQTSWRPAELPGSTLYWRVTATARSGLDGFPSTPLAFRPPVGAHGRVFEDVQGLGSEQAAQPVRNARVIAWRDNGNGSPDDSDVAAGDVTTDANGEFSFPDVAPALYWVAIDSRTVQPTRALNEGANASSVWAEQTYGSEGVLCGNELRSEDGACVGGRRLVTDTPARLSTSRHVGRLDLTSAERALLRFGFSFEVVSHVGDEAEDANGRSLQGSLRQFVRNSNAILGSDEMRFVPTTAPESGAWPWWRIRLASPLPPIDDIIGTELRGVASDAANPAQVRGALDEEGRQRTQLSIVARRDGLVLRGPARLMNIALSATGTVVSSTRPLTISDASIGTEPDGSATSGCVNAFQIMADARFDRVSINGCSGTSVQVTGRGILRAHGLVAKSSGPEPVVVFATERNTMNGSEIDGGGQSIAAIVIDGSASDVALTDTIVRGAASGVAIRGQASGNKLTRVRFEEISNAAVALEGNGTRNTVTEASFVNVKTLIGSPHEAAASAECTYTDGVANRGMGRAQITSFEEVPRELVALYGKACDGAIVDIYMGTMNERISAIPVGKTPAFNSHFALLLDSATPETRAFVTVTDADGNTSTATISDPPKRKAGRKKE